MSELIAGPFTRAGIDPTDGVPGSLGGDNFSNGGKEIFVAANYSGGSIDITFETAVEVDGQEVEDHVVTLQDGDVRLLGPWQPSVYGTNVHVSYSSNANVFVQVLRFDQV